MRKWYEYNIKDRYENVYKKHTIEDFWDWWSDGKDQVMEVRVTSFSMMKPYIDAFNIPYAPGGMFINQAWQLKKAIKYFRDKSTIWFGINPKRTLRNRKGFMSFSGKDINISRVKFLFIDIDRVLKDGPATNEDLMNADILSEKILDEFDTVGFVKNYCKICSGNGVQLIIKLDVPIDVPIPDFDENSNSYIMDSLFNETKNIFKVGIGKVLSEYSNQFKVKYNVEVDTTCFNIGRVGALPYSYNLKYDQPVIRGIIELKNEGPNEGLSDYLRSVFISKDIRKVAKNKIKNKDILVLSHEHKMKKNELNRNVIIDLMLNYKFPDGGINNTLWYGVKLLLHDSGIDNTDREFKSIHSKLKSIHNRDFTQNGLEPQYKNNYTGPIKEGDLTIVPAMVNKYLRLHPIVNLKNGKTGYHKPIFPVAPKGKNKHDIMIDITPKIFSTKPKEKYELSSSKEDPLKDLSDFSFKLSKLRNGEEVSECHITSTGKLTDIGKIILKKNLMEQFVNFIHEYREKWGDKKTAYMMRYYMNIYINYRRW